MKQYILKNESIKPPSKGFCRAYIEARNNFYTFGNSDSFILKFVVLCTKFSRYERRMMSTYIFLYKKGLSIFSHYPCKSIEDYVSIIDFFYLFYVKRHKIVFKKKIYL
jgi:hypothetical protein